MASPEFGVRLQGKYPYFHGLDPLLKHKRTGVTTGTSLADVAPPAS